MSISEYRVLITASGIGSRLGVYTKYTNKALIRVGDKPAISYIIESYPKNTQFVITLGHFGNQIRDFLKIVYKDRKFIFVEVDNYKEKGNSLVYSMLQAKNYLNCPFIFNACDTIVTDPIPKPGFNWIGGYMGQDSSNYRSFSCFRGKIRKILEKGALNPDYLHIGLVGINEYKSFWDALKKIYCQERYNPELSDVHVLNYMLGHKASFKIKEFKTWYDTGNAKSLQKAREELKDSFVNLDKPGESIFIFAKKSVVKFYHDSQLLKERVGRAKLLKGLIPEITAFSNNFFSYKYIKGDLYSEVANPKNFSEFLNWSCRELWKPTKEVPDEKFRKICFDFYHGKTNRRIKEFLDTRNLKDTENIINDEYMPSIQEMFKKINFDLLCDAKQSVFHGDYVLDNIIKTKTGFKLLDWRNNFGGLLKAGDKYYDLAKLNHNLTINHNIVFNNLFTVKIDKNRITLDVFRRENLVECQKTLFNFLNKKGYNAKKVKILTSLIWFSSSPLHHEPYDYFLFYFAKLNLWRILNEK